MPVCSPIFVSAQMVRAQQRMRRVNVETEESTKWQNAVVIIAQKLKKSNTKHAVPRTVNTAAYPSPSFLFDTQLYFLLKMMTCSLCWTVLQRGDAGWQLIFFGPPASITQINNNLGPLSVNSYVHARNLGVILITV